MANEGLQKVYDEKKKATLKKIQDAIDFMQADNRIVTKKELIELTGLSSGTFSHPYVKELLAENKVCQFRGIKIIIKEEEQQQIKEIMIEQMSKKIAFLESKLQDYGLYLEKKESDLAKAREDCEILQKDHILLRGKYQQALEYLDVLGADLSKISLV